MLLDSAWVPASLSCTARTVAKADNKVLYANISNEKLEIPEISLCQESSSIVFQIKKFKLPELLDVWTKQADARISRFLLQARIKY